MEPHFFQLLDRIRYQAALSALARDGKNLALISQVQALSDHYKEALLERLQLDVPGLEVKTFFPADPDGIVQSFNQVVGQMPVAQALDPKSVESGLKLWVVHDASALPPHELRLLLQLLEKFPGSQVRTLLVYGGVSALPDRLEDFEKSLVRWIVERPSLDQIKEALAQEQDPERMADLRALIQRMAPGGSNKEAVTAALNHHAASVAQSRAAAPAPARRSYKWLTVSMVALVLMVLSITVALKLHPDVVKQFGPVAELLQSTWAGWLGADPRPAASDKSKEPAVTAPSEASLEDPSQPKTLTSGAANPASPSPSSSGQDSLITELPEEAVKGEQWAWQLKANMIVIQHGISPTFAKAIEIRQQYPDLNDLHVVPQFIGNESQPRFALISGPYPSKEQAELWLKSKKAPNYSWVRTVAAMQERLLAKPADPQKP